MVLRMPIVTSSGESINSAAEDQTLIIVLALLWNSVQNVSTEGGGSISVILWRTVWRTVPWRIMLIIMVARCNHRVLLQLKEL